MRRWGFVVHYYFAFLFYNNAVIYMFAWPISNLSRRALYSSYINQHKGHGVHAGFIVSEMDQTVRAA